MAHAPGGTIFAPVSKQDPKHGRWILPLVVLALVLFTYTFVNSLPAAEIVTTTTVVAGATTTTTGPSEDTTTTTLAPAVVAFVATVDTLATDAAVMRADAQTINDEYPDVTGYGATRDLLSELKETTSAFAVRVAEVAVPESATEKWEDVKIASIAMESAADNMLDGLVNTSGSESRLAALEDYNVAAATLSQALDAAKKAAIAG
jgi:limonene-1,2-epoxide hydrolase